MRIGILDVGGNFFGPSFGFTRLGHEVRYCPVGLADYLTPLAAQHFELCTEPDLDVDLFVYAASFADEAWALQAEIRPDAPVDVDRPLLPSIHPHQALVRQRWIVPRLEGHPALALVDMSDVDFVTDPWFAANGSWRFRRELTAFRQDESVQPFPWLFQPALLWLELTQGLESVTLPLGARELREDLVFAGCVDHWRYRGQRERCLHELRVAHPDRQLRVETRLPLQETWRLLQSARAGLYLHGLGQLCFRLHELAALGVPAFAPEPLTIAVPEAWHRVLASDWNALRSSEEMLRFYVQEYHPLHAARFLLDRCAVPTSV